MNATQNVESVEHKTTCSGGWVPYFYVIQEVHTGMYYAGSKFAHDANPQTLLADGGYLTSSGKIKSLIRQNGIDSFQVRKVKTFTTGDEAYEYETRFLQKVNARIHPRFYNGHNNDRLLPSYGSAKYASFMMQKYGATTPGRCPALVEKAKLTKRSPEWKKTVGAAATKKRLDVVTSAAWKETIGVAAIEKRIDNTDHVAKGLSISATKSTTEWKETVGADAIRRTVEQTDQIARGAAIAATKNDPKWKATVGVQAANKQKQTMRDPTWVETVGKPARLKREQKVDRAAVGKKISLYQADPEWRRANSKQCPHCGKTVPTTSYRRFHDDNCKQAPHEQSAVEHKSQ